MEYTPFVTARHGATPNAIKKTLDLHYGEITTNGFRKETDVASYLQIIPPNRTYKNFKVDEQIRSQFVPTTKINIPIEEDMVEKRKPLFQPGMPRPEDIRYGDLDFPEITRSIGVYKRV